ncbi:aminotransferase class I/II-fold pyridoxal phosphate-dependent enzyme [Croceicoccus sp. YJ47]|uniref:aminotransferase class I/II-fold pyridoxal phosphate-dependent enzyme n=1 Tax=Croceicoccus sp. YJ47 TaxID=2798724 RepID=UPI001F43CF43|nr:PLP-dependent aminotransferase family protein [Croceicoccus sp. YJ47]
MRAEGIDVPIDAITTVPGCIAGLGVVVRSLVRPGGSVLIEDPASFAHVASLLAQGANIMRVPRRADGPDIDVLRTLCERHRPVVFVLSSLIQNPTGSCISLHNARQLIEIAAEFDLTLIDDGFNADLLPLGSSRALAPLMLLDNLDRVIHIGGSSRILEPQIGAGYIVAGERYIDMLRRFRLTHWLGNMLIQERVFFRFLDEGLYRRRCERVRTQLAHGAGALRNIFAGLGVTADPSMGGPHLWVDLGEDIDSADIARLMSARGFLTAPGRHFRPPKVVSSEMRFNVTTTSEEALQTLGEVLNRY